MNECHSNKQELQQVRFFIFLLFLLEKKNTNKFEISFQFR